MIPISNALLPGFTSERSAAGAREEVRSRVTGPDGTYLGDVVYVRRRRLAGSEYGWRPAGSPRARLTSKVEAVRRLPRFPAPT